ncbi:N/A [soil metagenome]
MGRDFTMSAYRELLEAFLMQGYKIIACEDYYGNAPEGKTLVLRHDVDDLPQNSLLKAHIEKELGARSTYYFRIVPQSDKPEFIKGIAELGHEIGYHYEDLSLAKGNTEVALQNFKKNLEHFRTFYPVITICMHGSPMSKWDNRAVWKAADYRNYGLIAEPYFDTDFNKVLYITDTGRKWDGDKVSVRDKVKTPLQDQHHYQSTVDIINALKTGKLPQQIMITTHPQRWHDDLYPWVKEYILQNIKNTIKKIFFVKK